MTSEKMCSVNSLLTKPKVIHDKKKCLGNVDVEHRLMPIWNLKKKGTTEGEGAYFFLITAETRLQIIHKMCNLENDESF